jgi:hypothetical protein
MKLILDIQVLCYYLILTLIICISFFHQVHRDFIILFYLFLKFIIVQMNIHPIFMMLTHQLNLYHWNPNFHLIQINFNFILFISIIIKMDHFL